MNIEVLENSESVAQRAASIIAEEAAEAIAARGCVRDGRERGSYALADVATIWPACGIPWRAVHIVQVDERVAPAGHTDRNLTHLRESLARRSTPCRADLCDARRIAPIWKRLPRNMPRLCGDRREACRSSIWFISGLGPDGHTASLVPGDPVLDVEDADVALSGPYQGRRRMTLTYPAINRARRILWVVTGSEKAGMVQISLLAG